MLINSKIQCITVTCFQLISSIMSSIIISLMWNILTKWNFSYDTVIRLSQNMLKVFIKLFEKALSLDLPIWFSKVNICSNYVLGDILLISFMAGITTEK